MSEARRGGGETVRSSQPPLVASYLGEMPNELLLRTTKPLLRVSSFRTPIRIYRFSMGESLNTLILHTWTTITCEFAFKMANIKIQRHRDIPKIRCNDGDNEYIPLCRWIFIFINL